MCQWKQWEVKKGISSEGCIGNLDAFAKNNWCEGTVPFEEVFGVSGLG